MLRALASVLGLGVVGWQVPTSAGGFVWEWDKVVFVDAAKQRRCFAWGLFCASVGPRFGWAGDGVFTQMCAELEGLCMGVFFAEDGPHYT